MIASFIDGRIRLRAELLKKDTIIQIIKEKLNSWNNQVIVENNKLTGSMLIIYDKNSINKDELVTILSGVSEKIKNNLKGRKIKKKSWLTKKRENYLLSASFILCLVGLFTAKRYNLHVIAGVVMSVLTIKHMWDRKKKF